MRVCWEKDFGPEDMEAIIGYAINNSSAKRGGSEAGHGQQVNLHGGQTEFEVKISGIQEETRRELHKASAFVQHSVATCPLYSTIRFERALYKGCD